jgi:O-antigen/teichoic acid export membrane protein
MMPVVTRLYSPDVLGVQSILISWGMIFSVLIGVSFQYFIGICKSDDTPKVFYLAIKLVLLNSIFLGGIIFGMDLPALLSLDYVLMYWAFVLGIVISIVNSLEQLSFKTKNMGLHNTSMLLQSAGGQGARLFLGYFTSSASALIFSTILSYCLRVLIYSRINLVNEKVYFGVIVRLKKFILNKEEMKFVSENMPVIFYRFPQGILSIINFNFPIILVACFYSNVDVGLLGLSTSVLGVLLTVFGSNLMNYYLTSFSEKKNSVGFISLKTYYLVFISITAFVFIVPIGLSLFGERIFSVVFGENWSDAASFALYLSYGYVFILSTRHVISLIITFGFERLFLSYEVISIIIRALILLKGSSDLDALSFVGVCSMLTALHYLSLFLLVSFYAKYKGILKA